MAEVSNDRRGERMRMNAGATEDRAIEQEFFVVGHLLQAPNRQSRRRV
jgi:hypothetical protein